MSTTTNSDVSAHLSTGRAVRAGAVVLAVSLVANLVLLAVGRLAGADLEVTEPDATEPTGVGVLPVVFATLLPVAVGTVVLVLATRWGRRAWSALAWIGLALGLVTIVMPFAADTDAGTAITLALMHVLLGVVWFVTLRREITAAA